MYVSGAASADGSTQAESHDPSCAVTATTYPSLKHERKENVNANVEAELRAEIARISALLEESERHVVELRAGVASIIWTLKEKQPAPRSASVTYVAGYARAMDDMRSAIMQVVAKESVTQAREVRSGFTEETRFLLEGDVARRAVVEDEDRPLPEPMEFPSGRPVEVMSWVRAPGLAGPFSDLKSRITYWPINDAAWPEAKTMTMMHDEFGEPTWIG